VVWDITIYAEDEARLEYILYAMRTNDGTRVIEARDEVLELASKRQDRHPFALSHWLTHHSSLCLYTSISHMVAFVSDGTAVLGLGDNGPLASMPVMEGKAILLNTKDSNEIVAVVVAIASTVAAIQITANWDIVITTTGAPNLIKPDMVCKEQIILAISNPNTEIDPDLALERGATFVADGNSMNNVLGFPGILRNVVD
jgi:malic enzyme